MYAVPSSTSTAPMGVMAKSSSPGWPERFSKSLASRNAGALIRVRVVPRRCGQRHRHQQARSGELLLARQAHQDGQHHRRDHQMMRKRRQRGGRRHHHRDRAPFAAARRARDARADAIGDAGGREPGGQHEHRRDDDRRFAGEPGQRLFRVQDPAPEVSASRASIATTSTRELLTDEQPQRDPQDRQKKDLLRLHCLRVPYLEKSGQVNAPGMWTLRSRRSETRRKNKTPPACARVLFFIIGAQKRTRTSTKLPPLAPEASASTNSATWAGAGRAFSGLRGHMSTHGFIHTVWIGPGCTMAE